MSQATIAAIDQAGAITRETALHFDADIVTLHMVEGGNLVLKGGFDRQGGKELSPGPPHTMDKDVNAGSPGHYAVPLKARETVIGMFAMERGGADFSAAECAAFECVAEHFTSFLRSDGETSFLPMLKLRVDSIAPEVGAGGKEDALMEATARGLEGLSVEAEDRTAALANLRQWLTAEIFAGYRGQLAWLIEQERWPLLLDSFYRVLPFGTGGRRGPVGIGPNRFNDITLASSVEGHSDFLRHLHVDDHGGEDLSVVIAYDVRCFYDLRGCYNPDLANPLDGLSSKDFAAIAAGTYAANGIRACMLPDDSGDFISTPELSYTIREIGAHGGLNISASHNPPDDNGGKFYNRFGGQYVPPADEDMANRVDKVTWLKRLGLDDARAAGWISDIPPDIHRKYIHMNVRQSLSPEARSARTVFTPLHGTGNTTVAQVLEKAGFAVDLVAAQSTLDGRFPSVPFQAPNPEVPESMAAGIELADELGADLVMACDPDADRIGLCARSGRGDFVFLNGNEIAVLVTHHKLSQLKRLGRLPDHPIVIKTEVTTELLGPITAAFGGRLIGDLLVGFKYHGNILEHFEHGRNYRGVSAGLEDFVVGVEESQGVLTTTEVHDKDAAGGAILLAELASQLKETGRTLVDYLDDIYLEYGYFANLLSSMVMAGAEGLRQIQKIQQSLRDHPPEKIGSWPVASMQDHRDEQGIHGPMLSGTDFASRDILVFQLENGARLIIRPSGTEPKNKVYTEVPRAPLGKGADAEALAAEKQAAQEIAQEISDDFTRHMLAIIGVELPGYALRISGLVSLENRMDFATRFLPEFETRCQDKAMSPAEISAWVDERLACYGKDARDLVSAAMAAYLATEREGDAVSPARAARLDAMETAFSDHR